MPHVALTNSNLYYDLHTVGDSTPLILLHAALGTHKEMAAIRSTFADRTTFAIDLPGHGDSTATEDGISTVNLAHTVLEFMESQDVVAADFIGYSMGGYVALEVAALQPERVRSVVAHATKFYWTPEVIETAGGGLSAAMLKKNAARYWEALEQAHVAVGAERTCELVAGLVQRFAQQMLTPDQITASGVPVLIMVGDGDELIPLEEVTRLHRALSPELSSVAVLPDTRHAIRTVQPSAFEAAVRHFWKSGVPGRTV